MVDINYFRDESLFQEILNSEKKRGNDTKRVELIKTLDEDWKEARYRAQEYQTEANRLQKEISKLKREKVPSDDENLQSLIKKMGELKDDIKKATMDADHFMELRDNTLRTIGNLVHPSVPESNDEKDNEVVQKVSLTLKEMGLSTDELGPPTFHHSELMEKLDMICMQQGSLVAGHRGYFLKGVGVLFNQALIQYALDFLRQKEYTLLQTPFMMNHDLMEKTAQLSDFTESLYKITNNENDTKYLIATSEQPISAFHYDEWLNPKDLPIKYCGYSTCFRKEAGAAGKDMRGIFRVHQFEKIEQFCITTPEESWNMHEKMLETSCEFLKSLGLSYQVVNIVSGELNNAAAKKYDVEAWFPNTKEYRELVSCSNCTDYQARNLLIRCGFKKKGEKTKFVHMLNSTMCATERTLCCILENYQTEKGIIVPQVLRKYMLGNPEFIPFVK